MQRHEQTEPGGRDIIDFGKIKVDIHAVGAYGIDLCFEIGAVDGVESSGRLKVKRSVFFFDDCFPLLFPFYCRVGICQTSSLVKYPSVSSDSIMRRR